MTAQLEKQTDALLSANTELEERRSFIEAVLESVSAGIISVDADLNVLLMNAPAQSMLGSGADRGSVGDPRRPGRRSVPWCVPACRRV